MTTKETIEIRKMMKRFQEEIESVTTSPFYGRKVIGPAEMQDDYSLCANYNYRVNGGLTYISDTPGAHPVENDGKIVNDHVDGKFHIQMTQAFYFNPKDIDKDRYVAGVIKNTLRAIVDDKIPSFYCYLSEFRGIAQLKCARYLEGCKEGPRVEIIAHFNLYTITQKEYFALCNSEEYRCKGVDILCCLNSTRDGDL